MQGVLRPDLYRLVHRIATARFRRGIQGFEISKEAGEPLYRYVTYRNNMPQAEDAGRKIFPTLPNDTSNRWTGRGADDGTGRQGLYLSGEFIVEGHSFPELEHYQTPGQDPNAQISYFHYRGGRRGGFDPLPATAKASELRSVASTSKSRSVSPGTS